MVSHDSSLPGARRSAAVLLSGIGLAGGIVVASAYGLLADQPYRDLPEATVLGAQTQDVCSVLVQLPYDAVSFMVADYLEGQTLSGHCAMRHE